MKKKRAHYLDILRIFCCLGVVFFHYGSPFPGLGDACVLIFFVLSGYLAGSNHDFPLPAGSFYLKKLVRLMPALFISITLSIALNYQHFLNNITSHEWWYYFAHPGRFRSLLETYNVALWFIIHLFIFNLFTPFLLRLNKCVLTLLSSVLIFAILSPFGDVLSTEPFSRGPLFVTLCMYVCGLTVRVSHIGYRLKRTTSFVLVVLFSIATVWLMELQMEHRNLYVVFCTLCWSFAIDQLYHTDSQFKSANKLAILSGMTYSIFLLHCPIIYSIYSPYILIPNYEHTSSIFIVCMLSYIIFRWAEQPIANYSRFFNKQ